MPLAPNDLCCPVSFHADPSRFIKGYPWTLEKWEKSLEVIKSNSPTIKKGMKMEIPWQSNGYKKSLQKSAATVTWSNCYGEISQEKEMLPLVKNCHESQLQGKN